MAANTKVYIKFIESKNWKDRIINVKSGAVAKAKMRKGHWR